MLTFDRHHRMFYFIATSEVPVTSNDLASALGVSVRTIKKDMNIVRSLAEQSGCVLVSKRGIGYHFEVMDDVTFFNAIYQLRIKTTYANFNLTSELAVEDNTIMQYMLSQEEPFRIDDLHDQFFIPKNSMATIMKTFKTFLQSYNLELVRKSSQGSRVEGAEFNKRVAMLMLFDLHFHKVEVDRPVESFFRYFEDTAEEVLRARSLLLGTLRHFGYKIHDDYSQCLSRYLVLQSKRKKYGHELEYNDNMQYYAGRFELQREIATVILNQMKEMTYQSYSDLDVDALVVLILLWTDSPLTADYEMLYSPVLPVVTEAVRGYQNYALKTYNLDLETIPEFELFTIGRTAPLIIHDMFQCNQFDMKAGNFVNQAFTNHMGTLLAQIFFEYMKKEHDIEFSQYLMDKTRQDLSLLANRVSYIKPLNILVTSGKGIEGSMNVAHLVKTYISDNIVAECRCIELYEGRGIPLESYDLLILDSLGSLFYAYDWPYLTVESIDIQGTLNAITQKILEVQAQMSAKRTQKLLQLVYSQGSKSRQKARDIIFPDTYTFEYSSALPYNSISIEPKMRIKYNFALEKATSLFDLSRAVEIQIKASQI